MNQSLETVARLVSEVIGGDPIEPITLQTSFWHDLELESIELVVLSEKIHKEYGDTVNFTEWLSRKELDELIHMTVGDLVEYIDSCLSSISTD